MAIRLLEAAKEFNIGKETLIEFLTDKNFVIGDKVSFKLTEKMYSALQSEFAQDKVTKLKSINISLTPSLSRYTLNNLQKKVLTNEDKIEKALKFLEEEERRKHNKEKEEERRKIIRKGNKLKAEISNASKKVLLNNLKEPKNKITANKPLNAAIDSTKNIKLSNDVQSFESIIIDWDDIIFGDGYIIVKYKGGWLEKFLVRNAIKS